MRKRLKLRAGRGARASQTICFAVRDYARLEARRNHRYRGQGPAMLEIMRRL
jgi:hypothetical protein